jgi:pyruvate,water dikinase
MSVECIYRIEELGKEFNNLVGKKCANLGEMAKIGLQVPPGFSLSVEAYKKFMSETGAGDEVNAYLNSLKHNFETIDHFNEASEVLRNIVESKEMPPDLNDAIIELYEEVSQKCGVENVAVSTRSAGASSHPGQFETHLNVIGRKEVVRHIIKVWSSTFNPRSLSARKRVGAPLESDPIGVAVIKMVNALSAGVLFTADPNTGDTSKMIIEANWGLGESVVGGEAMPDVFILDKGSLEIIEKKLGTKKNYITFKAFGVVDEKTTPEMQSSFCVTDEEIKELGRLGIALEKHFGVPQDTEWAVEKNRPCPENIVMLQARPEVIAKQKKPVDQVLDLMLSRMR